VISAAQFLFNTPTLQAVKTKSVPPINTAISLLTVAALKEELTLRGMAFGKLLKFDLATLLSDTCRDEAGGFERSAAQLISEAENSDACSNDGEGGANVDENFGEGWEKIDSDSERRHQSREGHGQRHGALQRERKGKGRTGGVDDEEEQEPKVQKTSGALDLAGPKLVHSENAATMFEALSKSYDVNAETVKMLNKNHMDQAQRGERQHSELTKLFAEVHGQTTGQKVKPTTLDKALQETGWDSPSDILEYDSVEALSAEIAIVAPLSYQRAMKMYFKKNKPKCKQ
jgi:hypothetical protein